MRAPRSLLVLLTVAGLGQVPAASAQEPSESAPPQELPAAPTQRRGAHPEPRVIVNVLSVRGPHEHAAVERSARMAWGKIVRCYKTIDQKARGDIQLELVIAGSGKVTSARRTASSLKNRELSSCLTRALRGLPMPTARARSTANAEIRVAPGDSP